SRARRKRRPSGPHRRRLRRLARVSDSYGRHGSPARTHRRRVARRHQPEGIVRAQRRGHPPRRGPPGPAHRPRRRRRAPGVDRISRGRSAAVRRHSPRAEDWIFPGPARQPAPVGPHSRRSLCPQLLLLLRRVLRSRHARRRHLDPRRRYRSARPLPGAAQRSCQWRRARQIGRGRRLRLPRFDGRGQRPALRRRRCRPAIAGAQEPRREERHGRLHQTQPQRPAPRGGWWLPADILL
ncbi:uncharacterized protein METZ01_LOCUS493877, partial [marine metagenome]